MKSDCPHRCRVASKNDDTMLSCGCVPPNCSCDRGPA
jgi:hypothetical protein